MKNTTEIQTGERLIPGSTFISKPSVALFISLQLAMSPAIGQSLFSVYPQLNFAENEEVKSATQAAVERGDEMAAIPIKADISVLGGEFIVFGVPNGPTYLFNRTSINEQGGKFGWHGETQGGVAYASFKRLEDGGLYANVYVSGAKESSALEAHYFARANPSGVGVLRKLSASPKNFPRHAPGTKRTNYMREPASCPAFAEPSSATSAAATPNVQIDVLVVHTKDADKTASGRLAADVRTAIEHCNTATKNSKVANITFNLVGPINAGTIPGSQLINYEEDDSNENAINWLSAENNDSIRQLRNTYAADIVMLVVGGNADNCGIANAFAHAEKAFGVAYAGGECLTRKYYAIAHEIGHIIGLDHDKDNLEGRSTFPYGRGAYITSPCVHTIMAYDMPCPGSTSRTSAESVFSFPGNFYTTSSASLGDIDADNRRVLSCQSPDVANFRIRNSFGGNIASNDQKSAMKAEMASPAFRAGPER